MREKELVRLSGADQKLMHTESLRCYSKIMAHHYSANLI